MVQISEITDSVVTYSPDLDTSYVALKPKDAVKTKLQWNTIRPPVNVYTPASSNFEIDFPTQGVIDPSETLATFWCAAANDALAPLGNDVDAGVYRRQVELLDSSSPFRRIDLVANDILIDTITDKSLIDSMMFSFVGDDYMQSVALETNLYAPSSVKKYYEGGELSATDIMGDSSLLVRLSGAVPANGDEVNTCVATQNKNNRMGVNHLLGLSLGTQLGGTPVANGNYYRMSLAGFFKSAKQLVLTPTCKIKLVFWLQNFSSAYYATTTDGANAPLPTQYVIRDFQLHLKKIDWPSSIRQAKIEKLLLGDSDPSQRAFYRYESYAIKQQQINANDQNIYVNHNINLPNVKAIFVVFRPNADINNLAVPDKKSCYVFPSTTANASAQYQWAIDGVQYPDDLISVGPKNTVRAFDMTAQAFDALDNYDGGTQIISASLLERGNFVLGLRLNANDAKIMAPSRWVGRLEFYFNMSAQAGAVYSCQTIVVYDTELAMGASVVDVRPLPQPSATN